MFTKNEGLSYKDGQNLWLDMELRYNGKSYDKNQIYSFCFENYKRGKNIDLLKHEIDWNNNALILYVFDRNSMEKKCRSIPFSELDAWKQDRHPIYVSVGTNEYTKKDLNLFCYVYISQHFHTSFKNYWVSHKTDELVIKYETGIFDKSVRVPLSSIEMDLTRMINEKRYLD